MNAAPEIAGRPIGPDHPPYIVAEMSANHLGDLDRALRIIEAAAACGADAVKIQTYTPDTITLDCDGPDFTLPDGLWAGRTLYDLYSEAQTPFEWHEALFAKAREVGITLFSAPFDFTAVDLLERLDAPAYKIASLEVVDLPLIRRAAEAGKPMIISSGTASLGEIADAVQAAREAGCRELILLHCVSSYPARFEEADLRTIPHLAEAFDVVSGLSDHTPGTAAAVAATALGAALIEKHFTLARADGGPDSAFSLEPDELTRLVEDTRNAHAALGRVRYDLVGAETTYVKFRRSLYVAEDVAAGEELTSRNVRSVRPGHGLAPRHLPDVLGRRAARDLKKGEALSWAAISGESS
ncbi:pseudaminic acid synthase [Marinicauda salina]|uniref:Pseudaminic acid synthase n=1 Tax=Marinicauda salina TaxID=2135793 RepID=A0A2U2BUB1_9PROT|nr:pseudaminic acid synthase [Marinicauda salina]PWE17570.1 pseudaminic acid synthase [Marinicauda salina]